MEAETARSASTHALTKKSLIRQLFPCVWMAVSALSVEKLEWRSLWFTSFSGTKMPFSPATETGA